MHAPKTYAMFAAGILLSPSTMTRVHAQSGIEPANIERVGQSGWQFLKINGDARIAAMAGIAAATARGDASAVFSNPSALVDINKTDLAFNRANWIADIGYQSLALARNFNGLGVFAISVASVDYGEIPETINSLTPAGDRTNAVVTGSLFTASDIAAGISYARRVTDRLSIGANARWIREEIAELSVSNWSLDFGTTYYTGFKSLRLGMVARNFGPDAHLVGWSEEFQAEAEDIRMPIDFRIGLAVDFFADAADRNFLTVTLEGDHPNDGPEKLHFGAEYSFNKLVILRAGYRFNYDEENLTLGGGLKYTAGKLAARINYAYVDFGALNQVHVFSLGLAFDY